VRGHVPSVHCASPICCRRCIASLSFSGKRGEGEIVAATHKIGVSAALLVCLSGAGRAADVPDTPPAWAFPVPAPGHHPAPENPKAIAHVAGSTAAYRWGDVQNPAFRLSWFPGEHPPMPWIVAITSGHTPFGCSFCHGETGLGGPESASLAGLSANYIVEQVLEMKAGRRRVAEPEMRAPRGMMAEAQQVGLADLKTAADYFSKLQNKSRIRVIESDTAPQTVVESDLYARAPGGGSEPLGQRIVEIPEDIKQWELGNPHAKYVAYVPKGSIARGEQLVLSGDGATPCRTCHGADLKGADDIPGIAGRSPSYLARQLYDIQHGTRTGRTVAQMLPEVRHMTQADRIAIVAYLASLGSRPN
jgi:cytochrome c553